MNDKDINASGNPDNLSPEEIIGPDDDLEAQMAAAIAAEGLSGSSDEDDLEAQMAAAMAAESTDDMDSIGKDFGFDDDEMQSNVSSSQARPIQFQQLYQSDETSDKNNVERLLDVILTLSVEPGRKNMQIKEILELGPGKIIELDKLAGEPVDLLVNGKLLAKGEVVVVDENFGVRITDLLEPKERIKSLR